MSSRSLRWRRMGIGAVAAATLVAGLPVLLGTPASAAGAGAPTRLDITRVTDPQRTTAAAGTCTAYEVTAKNAQGGEPAPATLTVTIAEDPNDEDHDVDFCLVDGGTAFRTPPQYTNEPAADGPDCCPFGEDRYYDAGASISTSPGDSGQPPAGSARASDFNDGGSSTSPDRPEQESSQVLGTPSANNNFNPSGEDLASFSTVAGVVRFGLVGLQPASSATIDAFVDNNGDRDRNRNPVTGAFGDPVTAPQKSLTFTAGGRPGTNAASDAVRFVEVTPESSFEALGSSHTFRAVFRNQQLDVVGGVSFARIIATAGPNAPTSTNPSGTFSETCGQSGNEGEAATCTYTPQLTGTDTVTVFVNQTMGNPTFGPDANEPRDTATATTTATPVAASQARILDLTPESTSLSAGTGRQFVATVTDANGAPANGVSVTFFENGPGFLRGGTINGTASTVTFVTGDPATTNSGSGPAGPGRALAFFVTNAGDIGGNTVTASITTPASTQCQQGASGTLPAGQCSDTSAVTITAAASPSPSPSTTATASPTASASPSSTATATPAADESRYRGLASPVRVLDTREEGTKQRRSGEIVVDLSGQITDASATSAVLNVTVTNGTQRGFLVAYPNGTTKPGTSNVNFEANQTQANEVVVRMSSSKKVSLFVDSASAHVIADLVGSFTPSTASDTGRVTTNAPVRAFDSRNTATPTRRNEVVIDLGGRLPSGATDAVLNVTVTRTSARGFVTVFPTGVTRPGTSNVNFEGGQTQANEVITRVGSGSNAGKVSFFIDSAAAALIVDVVGAVTPGTTAGSQTFTALSSPQRALDTRNNRGPRRTGNIELPMPSSIPAEATGVILNVTATNGTRPGFVTVFQFGQTNPGTSNVNFPTNLTQANEVTTGLGSNNRVTLFVGGANSPAAHVIVDVVGYLTD